MPHVLRDVLQRSASSISQIELISKPLLSNALSMGVVQLVNLGLPLIWLPYLARVLGAEQLGRIAFALAAAQVLVIVTDYGFNLSATKAIALNRASKGKVTEIWIAVTCSRLILALMGLSAILIASLLFDRARSELGLLLAAYVLVIGNVIYPQWLFQGLERLRLISLIQVVARVLISCLILLLVKAEDDIYWATLLQGGGTLLGGLLAIPLVRRELDRGSLRLPTVSVLHAQFREGWHIFISTAAVSIYTSCNAFFLGMIVSPSALGYYHVAEKLIRAVQSLYGAVSNAIYPHVSRLASESVESLLHFNKKLMLFFVSSALIVAAITYFAAPFAVKMTFGAEFVPSAAILQIMSPVIVIVVISNVFGIQTMLPLGMESKFSRILISAAFLNFALFIPLATLAGIRGAALANVLVEVFVTVSMAIILYRKGLNPVFTAKAASRQP